MKLSGNQLERLADRVFRVLKASGHIELDYADERIEERTLDAILNVLEEDSRAEEKLSREAERLVSQQTQIAKQSGKSVDELVEEVKIRLAKAKRVSLDDGPERADLIAEKVLRTLWRLEGIDFFSDDQKVQNCIGRAIYRFRVEDDRIVDAVERLVSRKTEESAYSPKWCAVYDKYFQEVRTKLANNAKVPLSTPPTEPATEA